MNLTSGTRSKSCCACAVSGSGEEMVAVPAVVAARAVRLGASKAEGNIGESPPLVGTEPLLGYKKGPEITLAGLANCETFVKLLADKVLGLAKGERVPGTPLGNVRSLEVVTGGRALAKSEKISPVASKSAVVLLNSKVTAGWVVRVKGTVEGSALEKLVNSSSSSPFPTTVMYGVCTVLVGSWREGCSGSACTKDEKLSSTSA